MRQIPPIILTNFNHALNKLLEILTWKCAQINCQKENDRLGGLTKWLEFILAL